MTSPPSVISYTLYPEAMADVMAAETLRALMWTLTHARRYGGDPSRLAVAGHSAGAHLGSLALVMLAQLRRQEAEEARQVGRGGGASRRGGGAAAEDGGGGGEDGGAPWHPGPALALPRVQLFIGMR
jgi:acetyl esterase/lipase